MNRGFSLLELSIVLVIIGLITGGIMAGQSMVKAAEIRSVLSDLNKYQTAINTFKEKYGGLPGDLNNAVRYWGAQAGATTDGADATCIALTTAATGTATCNGNGNGQIYANTANLLYEQYRAWQHLANAGLIEGQYTGIATGGTYADMTPGLNIPASKRTGGGYFLTYTIGGTTIATETQNLLWVGADGGGNAYNIYGLFTTAEMYGIDQKIDDGVPLVGAVKSMNYYVTTCTTTQVATTAAYALTTSGNICAFYYTLGY